MKLTQKHLRLFSGLFLLLGAVIAVLTRNYNTNNPEDTNRHQYQISHTANLSKMISIKQK
jgi:CHASE3 domain sensor protein